MENFYFDTPGNLLKYFLSLNNKNIDLNKDTLKCIFHFMDQYKNQKSLENLAFISIFIEKFFKELCHDSRGNLNNYYFTQSKILKQINNMKNFNLDEKNVFIWIKDILKNEKT